MGLEHAEEEKRRLSPEEARAFLQVHAERETAPDSPTIGELADFLDLPPEEAKAILTEARKRIALGPSLRPTRRRPRLLIAAASALGLIAVVQALAQVSYAPNPPLVVATAVRTGTAAPAVPQIPKGFSVTLAIPALSMEGEGQTAEFGTDFRRLGAGETVDLQRKLAAGTLGLVEDGLRGNEAHWRKAKAMAVRVRIGNGEWTTFWVPFKPFTFPFEGNPKGRADVEETLRRQYAGQWSKILQRAPR